MGNALVYRWGKLRAAVLQGRGSPPTLPQKRRSRSTGTQVMWGGGSQTQSPGHQLQLWVQCWCTQEALNTCLSNE